MFTFKESVTAIGIVAFLGLEVYGFYSIQHVLDTHLSRVETGIESVRAADALPDNPWPGTLSHSRATAATSPPTADPPGPGL